jgi:ABC-2 type transport system ATP-binding protein
MPYIDVQGLTKTFTVRKKRDGHLLREKSTVCALDHVSFQVEQGELLGYIGPNGAGKSTTVKLLCGILTADGGTATVDGLVPWQSRKQHARNIGVVFGQRSQLWWDVPVIDSYQLLRDIYRVPESQYQKRLNELTEALSLGDFLHTPLRLLSLGQRMRAELGGSLLHSPKLLFLDEPTIGLDAVSKLQLRDFLLSENHAHGTTIMLTTHDMEDISALCRRVLVLGHGKKLFDGELPALLARYDTVRTLRVRYAGDIALPALPESVQINRDGDFYVLTYPQQQVPTDHILTLLQSAGPIAELTLHERSMDHMIADMYREMAL